jgi:hypothetical protein
MSEMNLDRVRAALTNSPLAALTTISSLLAVLGMLTPLPAAIRGPAILLFLMVGPGSATMLWVEDLPSALRRSLIPAVGIGVVIIISTLAVTEGLWHPVWELALLIMANLGSVLAHTVHRSSPVDAIADHGR